MVQFEYDSTDISPIPVEHLTRIGEMAVAAARLEYVVASLVWEIIDEDETIGMAVTAGVAFEKLMRLVASLGEARLGAQSSALELYHSVSKISMDAMNERNRLLHGRWHKDWHEIASGNPRLITRNRKGKLDVRLDVSVEDIREVTGKLVAASQFMQLAVYQVWAELDRLVQTPDGEWTRRQ